MSNRHQTPKHYVVWHNFGWRSHAAIPYPDEFAGQEEHIAACWSHRDKVEAEIRAQIAAFVREPGHTSFEDLARGIEKGAYNR